MSNNLTVPLEALRLSAGNARKTGGDDVADLVASIGAGGLLQNLVVVASDTGYDVIAGGRRLKALQQLAAEGRLPADLQQNGIPCRCLDDTAAIEASTAENTIRVPMHPADQFDAFRAMIDGGQSVVDVAAHFGIAEIVVQRRLRLAKVAPDLLAEYRAGRATLEQITALAITEDHDAQRMAWTAGEREHYRRHPEALRKALTAREIGSTDYRVRLVGLDAYKAAGGPVRQDLFDDTGGGYLQDEALLDRLVEDRLQAVAGELASEGWSFVKVDTSEDPWKFRGGCDRTEPKRVARELSPDQQSRLAEVTARIAALDAELEALDEAGEDVYEEDPRVIELELLRSEAADLEQDVETYSPRQMAKAGCLVSVDRYSGKLNIERGLIPRKAAAVNGAAAAQAEAKGEPAPAKVAVLSESMIRRLTAHRTIALQAALVRNADVALAALAHALLVPILFPGPAESALSVSATRQLDSVDRLGFDDVSNSPHLKATTEALQQLRDTLKVPDRAAALLPWLLQQGRETVTALLAAVAAYTVNATQDNDRKHPAAELIAALDIDMADYWAPTAATFFSVVPKSIGLEAVLEVQDKVGIITGQLFAGVKLSKDQIAGQCEQCMRRTGWLPKILRRPGYRLRAEAAPSPPGRKAAAAKPGKSPAATKKAGKRAVAKKKPAKSKPAKAPAKKKPAKR